jgi:hypothetical protein
MRETSDVLNVMAGGKEAQGRNLGLPVENGRSQCCRMEDTFRSLPKRLHFSPCRKLLASLHFT